MLIADGEWRRGGPWDTTAPIINLMEIRWKARVWPGNCLLGRDGVERNYWRWKNGRWTKKGWPLGGAANSKP
jgi:hypothetical protein